MPADDIMPASSEHRLRDRTYTMVAPLVRLSTSRSECSFEIMCSTLKLMLSRRKLLENLTAFLIRSCWLISARTSGVADAVSARIGVCGKMSRS